MAGEYKFLYKPPQENKNRKKESGSASLGRKGVVIVDPQKPMRPAPYSNGKTELAP
ncbi:hypothetical protein [Candidatus Manganitrophus noduliformans]|uniref:hypothetical protein n=1 Tax=Candidatus Manganitrophus noduliformans TaxID=2606439 RepID=UPI00143A2DC5|nr:hypothetical protein [Candidatus Manganitrophus noduliformans]